MISCSLGRWLLQACMITAMISVGNSLDLCEKYDTFGFESESECIHTSNNLAKSWQTAIRASNLLGIVSQNVSSKLEKLFVMEYLNKFKNQKLRMQDRTLTDGAQFLSQKGLPPKKRVTLKDVNKEQGFDLTKEEITKFKIWDKGVIPYFIDEHSFDKVLRDRIRFILDEVNAATSLQFMEIPRPPVDNDVRYVFFINRRGALKCVDYSSDDFSNQGLQKVILGYDCINLNTGLAAIILTLVGVPPQHNAPNRNKYIEIVEDSIIPEKVPLFTKLKAEDWLFHDVAYDFESATHYHYHKYSAIGHSTILPKKYEVEAAKVGEDKTFSFSDLLKINMLYNYISKGPNGKKISDCSQMFQPGRDFNKYKPTKNNLKPRRKPAKYTKEKVTNKLKDENLEGASVNRYYYNEISVNDDSNNNYSESAGSYDDDNNNNDSGIGIENKGTVEPEKLTGHRGPMSAETLKRLKLKQIIQNESDFHTEERK